MRSNPPDFFNAIPGWLLLGGAVLLSLAAVALVLLVGWLRSPKRPGPYRAYKWPSPYRAYKWPGRRWYWPFTILVVALVLLVGWLRSPKRPGPYRAYKRPGRRWYWPFTILVVVLFSGCAERAVIVPPTVPVRLAEQLFSVSVWVKDANGEEVKARADLFPGMIIATDPEDFPTAARARFMNLRRDQ